MVTTTPAQSPSDRAARRIAVLHPGRMGAAVARALRLAGHEVGWVPEGRSEGTRRRALEAGLTAVTSASELASYDVVVSLCPPDAALETARGLHGFTGLYVDANAVSPDTARAVASTVRDRGAEHVDAAVVGPPPVTAGSTRLYLSGRRATEVAGLFADTPVQPVVLDGDDVAASALKMAYAAWTKITAALLVGVDDTARALGVEEALRAEWALSQPELASRLTAARESAVTKGWRWTGEMHEIGRTLSAAGTPTGFADGAAEVFARWPRPQEG
ncbi:DUF1932 domain-containing protein [Kineococcus sp. LSe6-4]|uniref:DUF1932 domain-containing protein n=1 Tax=Kineococcus halophytocola TaxID=3234027 RepID=A0ABV4H371_9ACTN